MSRNKKPFKRTNHFKPVEAPVRRKDAVPRLLGVKDVNSADYKYWNCLMTKISETANLYGFARVETPILENAALYKKYPRPDELYSLVINRSDKVTLRPDLTHGLARFYLEADFDPLKTVKFFSFGPVFRQEDRLQSGCYRQFTQFAWEIFGEAKPIGEALLMAIVYNLFKELQINVQVQINSVGNFDCQKEYLNKLAKYYRDHSRKIKLCPDCRRYILKNPLKLLNCQNPICQEAKQEAPQITNFLSEESNAYFTKVLEYLDELGINYNFNPLLVKNLNYYTETIFEVWPLNDQGEIDGRLSLGRGGRYNNLLEQVAGRNLPALGFSGGFERIIMKLKEKNLPFKKDENIIFVAQVSDSARLKAIGLFTELNQAGFKVRQSFTTDDLREQLEEAKRQDAKIILILGKKEVSSGTVLFRDVDQGIQEVITQKDLCDRLKKRFNNKKEV